MSIPLTCCTVEVYRTQMGQTDKRTSISAEITCVRNVRNSLFRKRAVFDFLGCFKKLFSVIILGVRNFRVFEILEHLPYSNYTAKCIQIDGS